MSQENETQVEELETETNEEYGDDQESTEEDSVPEQEQEQEEEQVDWQARYEEERQARERAERAIEKNKRKAKESKPQEQESNSNHDQELVNRTYLAAQADIKDKDVQNEALRLAEKFGMSIAEAVEDPDISTRIKNMQKQKQSEAAIAKTSGGSQRTTKDVNYYVSYFNKHGDFPADTPSSMIAKVTGKLAQN